MTRCDEEPRVAASGEVEGKRMQDQADPHIVEQSQPNQPRGRRLLLIGGIVGTLGFTLAVGMVRGGKPGNPSHMVC
jgi:hypothetical protein